MASEDPVTRWLAGSREALGELFEQWAPALRLFLRPILAHEEDIEDVVTDIFVQLLAGRHHYDPEVRPFGTWLRTVARNRARDRLRSRALNRRSFQSLSDPATPDLSAVPGPLGQDHLEELTATDLEAALRARLDPRENEVLTLLLAGFSTAEVCEQMDLSQPTVWRLRRSLQLKASEVLGAPGPETPG